MENRSALDYDFSVTKILNVVERQPDPAWRLPLMPVQGHFVLCASLEGGVHYRLLSEDISDLYAETGDVLFFSGTCLREANSIPTHPWHFISTTFDIHAYNTHTVGLLRSIPLCTRAVLPAIQNDFLELNRVWTGHEPGHLLKCRALLESILYELIRQNNADRSGSVHYDKIESIRLYLQEHYDQNFCVQELAEMAHCSTSHFRKLFKEIVGMTATQYLTMVRVYKAKDFLLSGEMNVSEAAARTGYHDIFYFSRQFKAVTGHSPSYYAK